MNRFWVFPLVLGAAGAVLGVAALLEGIAPVLPVVNFRIPMAAMFVWAGMDFLTPVISQNLLALASGPGSPYNLRALIETGAGVGALLGLVAGVFDVVRNRARPRSGSQLLENVAWCLLYAHAVIAVNVALVSWWLLHSGMRIGPLGLTVWLPGALWLLALTWATIRTIATDDVLTPRVLLLKLRRSSTLES